MDIPRQTALTQAATTLSAVDLQDPVSALSDDDRLSLTIGRVARAHANLDYKLRTVLSVLVTDASQQFQGHVGTRQMIDECRKALRAAPVPTYVVKAGSVALEAAAEANVARNGIVHDLWSLASDSTSTEAATWNVFGPGDSNVETVTTSRVEGALTALERAAFQVSGLFMTLNALLVEPARHGGQRPPGDVAIYVELMEGRFELDGRDGWRVIPASPEAAVKAALDVLSGPRWHHADAITMVPHRPGLYAIHADDDAWKQLGLTPAFAGQPLYVGKAESDLNGRDVGTHFSTGRTGSSTVRRSLAALLSETVPMQAVPRNLDRPDGSANFALAATDDEILTKWMRLHLAVSTWVCPEGSALDAIETSVVRQLRPPLNLSKVDEPRDRLRRARQRLADQSRAWHDSRH